MAAVVLATRNAHKLREFQRLLPDVELEPLPDEIELPPETGDTFGENALIKARAAAEATNRPAIADDSGIEAEALGGRPGRAVRPLRRRARHRRREPRQAARRGAARLRAALRLRGRLHRARRGPAHGRGDLRGPHGRGAPRRRRLRLRPRLRPRGRRRYPHDGGAVRRGEGPHLAPRTRRPGGGGMAAEPVSHGAGSRSRAAGLSIASNSALILLKIVAGAVTGSVAIVTEAIHSGTALLAWLVPSFSVRQPEPPADSSHRYGHEKFENVAAGVEGMLILV